MAMEEGQEEAARAPGGAAGGASPFAAAPASIAAIDSESVARICSGQVVVDLAGAVKELVENSLDAKATHIEVKLKGSGLDSIEVADNGQGVSPKDYEGLALKHHTSKLTSFSDLTTVSSFGFRGEALSSICELAGSFEVSTRTAEEEVGTRLTFDRSGKLVKQDVSPRPVGTSVHIGELFSPLPVRRAEMARTIQRHKTKLLRLLQAYALVSVGVRITVTDRPQGRKGGTCRILATQSGSNLGQNVASIFGSKAVAALQPLNVDAGGGVRIEGMVSRAGEGVGRSDSDRQFTFVNGRPVDLSRALKALNEVWRHYEMKAKPSAVLDVKLPPGSFDVNVTPDKREVFITSELEIIDSLKAALHELWAPSRCTFKVNQASVQLPLTDFMQKTVMEKAEAALGGDGGGIEGDSLPASSSEDEADSDLIIPPMRSRSRVRTEQPSIEDVEDEVAAPISPPKSKTVASRGKRHTAREKPPSYSDDEDDGVIAVPGPRAPTLHVEKEAGEDGSQSTNSVDATDVKCVPPEVCSGALQESSIPVDGSGDALASAPSSASAKKPEEGNSSDHPPASSTVKGTEYVKAILPRAPDASSDSSAGKAKSKLLSFESMAFGASSRDAVASPCKSCSSSPSLAASPAAQMLPSLCSAGADLAARKRGQNRSHSGPSPQATKRRKAGIIAPPVPGSERVIVLAGADVDRHDEESDDDVQTIGVRPSRTVEWNFDAAEALRGAVTCSGSSEPASGMQEPALENNAVLKEASAEADATVAARALSRVLKKEHFKQMEIIGQFNLGFIIARLGNDLFILDQHASDEKFNFETLQKSTVMHQQPLVRPMVLEVAASEEEVIAEHLPVFEKNGFCLKVDGNAPPMQRISVTAVPFSKGTQFGVSDIHELASIIADDPLHSEDARLPKIRSMFAMRACRSSIMIGTALRYPQMVSVVHKLSELEQPWNCPHGRPTLRHLVDLGDAKSCAWATKS